ncbi:MAG: hypothetical protein KF901_02195 [Myxococcales bacterium]|nr:hypothetical protein [Myxococcales bacterium]
MSQGLGGVRAGEPWSYSQLVHGGLDDVLDDEGRPLGERRATSAAKEGVPFLLKSCPYSDARLGNPMNVSALAQVARHTDAVLDAIAAFRAASPPGEPTWSDILTAVVDLLGAPASYLLRHPERSTLPAELAVAHKLGAGYFGVVRGLVARATVEPGRVGVEELLSFAHGSGALVGASEACAGPPPMLARATEVLIHGRPDARPLEDPARVEVASLFRRQIEIGMAWERFDVALEAEAAEVVMRGQPRSSFYARQLEARRAAPPKPRDPAAPALPRDLDLTLAGPLRDALGRDAASPETLASLRGLDENGAGAVVLEAADRASLLAMLASYLEVQAVVAEALFALERDLRDALGVTREPPMNLHATIFPRPTSLHWLQTALGVRVATPTASEPRARVTPLATTALKMGT